MPTASADPIIEPHRWYSVQVVARLIGVSDDCIRHRIKTKSLPAARMPTAGGQGPWRVKGDDILQLIGKMELARGGGGIVERPPPRRSNAERLTEMYRKLKAEGTK